MTAGAPRLPMLPVEEARRIAGEIGVPESMAEYSVFQVLLHHPKLAAAVWGLLGMLLGMGNHLDARLRELLILRIGWKTGSAYEWAQHWRIARLLGIPEDDLLAVRNWQNATCLSEADRAVLAATDETLETGAISAATWARCVAAVDGDERALLEIPVAIGNWTLFSQMLQSLAIPVEAGVLAWPPDGARPPSSGRSADRSA